MFLPIVILVLLFFVGIWLIAIYNKLVRYRNLVEEAWSGIDVQLKRRSNLIPNLIETVKGYLKHEKTLLAEVTELRSKSMGLKEIGERGKMENALGRSLANLFAVAEAYPDLKANQNFIDLQSQLASVEDQIQMARRYFNGSVRNLNILIESFPSNQVAKMFNFTKKEFFEIEDQKDRTVPKVKF
jgi:LemA protein